MSAPLTKQEVEKMVTDWYKALDVHEPQVVVEQYDGYSVADDLNGDNLLDLILQDNRGIVTLLASPGLVRRSSATPAGAC